MNFWYIAILVLPTIIIEMIICKFFKKRLIIYAVPLLSFIGGIVLIIMARIVPSEGMKDLANIVMAMMCFIIAFTSFVVAIINEIIQKKKRYRL